MEREKDDENTGYELVNCDESWKKDIPIGFRFCPTIDELFLYLINRVSSNPIHHGIIHDFDVYKCHPSDLPEGFKKLHDGENNYAYFFTHRHKVNSNPNSKNQKRSTDDDKGSWKASNSPVSYAQGKKNTLVYHLKIPGKKSTFKTNWIMHEFILHDYSVAKNPQDKNLVLCRMYERNDESAKGDQNQQVCTLKRKEHPVEQPQANYYYNNYNVGFGQPKMSEFLYSPTIQEPAKYRCTNSITDGNQYLFESVYKREEYYYPMMSVSSSIWPRDEPQPPQDSAIDNNNNSNNNVVTAWENLQQQQQYDTFYRDGICARKIGIFLSQAASLATTVPNLKTGP